MYVHTYACKKRMGELAVKLMKIAISMARAVSRRKIKF